MDNMIRIIKNSCVHFSLGYFSILLKVKEILLLELINPFSLIS